jgi:hypothetical protein
MVVHDLAYHRITLRCAARLLEFGVVPSRSFRDKAYDDAGCASNKAAPVEKSLVADRNRTSGVRHHSR